MSDTVPTPEELTALCREWQERLRLQDWRVRVRYSKEFEIDGKQARVDAKLYFKAAVIYINPFVENDDPDANYCPIELRVIHELVHLHWEPIWPKCKRDSIAWDMAEAAVDSLAWALYRAKYGEKAVDHFVATN